MIVRIPDSPPVNEKGHFPYPMVLLYGAVEGTWQNKAAKILSKAAKAVVCTDVPKLHPVHHWAHALQLMEAADVVLCWNGNDKDTLYLNEWVFLSYLIGRWPTKLVCGMEREPDHPMSNSLRYLLENQRVHYQFTLEDTLSVAHEWCRELRRIPHGKNY